MKKISKILILSVLLIIGMGIYFQELLNANACNTIEVKTIENEKIREASNLVDATDFFAKSVDIIEDSNLYNNLINEIVKSEIHDLRIIISDETYIKDNIVYIRADEPYGKITEMYKTYKNLNN